VLLALVIAAGAIRVAYFTQAQDTPILAMHRWDQSDMAFFHHWARVLGGVGDQDQTSDWLQDQPLHPLHDWHRGIARAFFVQHPDVFLLHSPQHIEGLSEDDARATGLWNEWYGGKRYHQEPLYPYLIAALYQLTADDVRVVFALQLVMGVLSILLIHLITRWWAGDAAALVASILVLLCGPLTYYEMVLLRVTLTTFLGLLTIAAIAWACRPRNTPWRGWLAAGGAAGLAFLAQSSLFPLVIVGNLVALLHHRDIPITTGQRSGQAALFLAGFTLMLTPVVIRNVIVGAPPLSLSSVGVVTFIATNGPQQHADFSFNAGPDLLRILPRTYHDKWAAIRATLALHDGVGSYFTLLGRKLAVAWHHTEKPNNASFIRYRWDAWILYLLPITFGITGPLGVVGLVLGLGKRHRGIIFALLAGLALIGFASAIGAAPHGRYRAPLMAWLAPAAGLAIVSIARAAITRKWTTFGLTFAACALLIAIAHRPAPPGVQGIRLVDYLTPLETWYIPQANAAATAQHWSRAQSLLEKSCRHLPPGVAQAERTGITDDLDVQSAARIFAGLLQSHADVLRRLGDVQQALAIERRAITLANVHLQAEPPDNR
jgi:4-amino-4-deoxy-L-arabinose transferase-like glycosyltransferase